MIFVSGYGGHVHALVLLDVAGRPLVVARCRAPLHRTFPAVLTRFYFYANSEFFAASCEVIPNTLFWHNSCINLREVLAFLACSYSVTLVCVRFRLWSAARWHARAPPPPVPPLVFPFSSHMPPTSCRCGAHYYVRKIKGFDQLHTFTTMPVYFT